MIISVAFEFQLLYLRKVLSFLGLGVSIPMPSLGSLASAALTGVYSYSIV